MHYTFYCSSHTKIKCKNKSCYAVRMNISLHPANILIYINVIVYYLCKNTTWVDSPAFTHVMLIRLQLKQKRTFLYTYLLENDLIERSLSNVFSAKLSLLEMCERQRDIFQLSRCVLHHQPSGSSIKG